MLLSIKNKVVDSLKKQALFVCFFICFNSLSSQNNLVFDGGFDIYKPVPFINQVSNSVYWFVPNNSSPDVFHKRFFGGAPSNNVGYQYPISDSAYVGIIIHAQNIANGREYIETKLSSPLKKGYTYCVEFYVSLADTVDYAASSIGAFFSNDSINISCSFCVLNFIPQVQNDSLNLITDKKNWVKISGSFIASGAEKYLTIGNFYDDTFTERHIQKVSNHNLLGWSEFAYYYIENVSVYACDSPLVEEPQDTTFVFIPNVFSPNQDGENDLWQVTASKVSSLNIQVFNRWGEQVYKINLTNEEEPTNFNPAWDGYTPTGKLASEGTYFYIVQYTLPSGEVKVEKGNLSILR